ncbi:hypothetical protein SAMN02745148_03221 [Modicisalibacter ilicicola DSM 19980]|uniref:Amine oxidase domain-containing protein n=1 Tax=Modicisalibacter ilicicola DSM 19980 TaxID=1121942 RepID=A0A1M5DFW4_9GAMM|nr:FAD-dependent oxidoreductase [Halomonas ilicicola]SHF65806.1 hypothetical protein SAMN02745148_03221 [Halomonas ilicicola DSM 19980]
MKTLDCAIIGGGIAGLACGRALTAGGHAVELFEKSRGPGGRLASRRTPEAVFDIGAQYLTARNPEFQAEVRHWHQAGIVDRWPESLWVCDAEGWQRKPDDPPRWVGTPRMSAVTRHLSRGLKLHSQRRIERLSGTAQNWWLQDSQDVRHGPFTRVVIALPLPQAERLLAPQGGLLARACQRVGMRPCWTAYALFDRPLTHLASPSPDWQAAFINQGPLRFVTRNHSKPGRGGQGESLSLLASPEWSQANLEQDPQWVATRLLEAFAEHYPARLPGTRLVSAHRWRYAQPEARKEGDETREFLIDSRGLALCGDGLSEGRVEAAWLSGHRLGTHLNLNDLEETLS